MALEEMKQELIDCTVDSCLNDSVFLRLIVEEYLALDNEDRVHQLYQEMIL